jgi:uncharacterized CHY-type Zn-finger protein
MIQIREGKRDKEGSCYFCTSKEEKLFVINSSHPDRRITVLICSKCAEELKKYLIKEQNPDCFYLGGPGCGNIRLKTNKEKIPIPIFENEFEGEE